MGKAIELTWRNGDGELRVEYCLMVADDMPISVVGIGVPTGKTVADISGDMVMFEDGEGLFGVPPRDVINIRHLK